MRARPACPDTCEVREGEQTDAELLRQRDEVRGGLGVWPRPPQAQPQQGEHHQRLKHEDQRLDSGYFIINGKKSIVLYRCWAVTEKSIAFNIFHS